MGFYSKKRIIASIFIIVIIMSLLISGLSNLTVDEIVNFTPPSMPLAVLVFLSFYALKTFTLFFPIAVVYMSAGIVFPVAWAVVITYFGLASMKSVGYITGRKLGEAKMSEFLSKKKDVADFLYGKKDNLTSLCFISRVLPLPITVCNLFFGAVKMPFPKYVLISLLGLTPTMIPLVIAGTNVSNPLSFEFLLPFGVSLAIALTVFIIYRIMARKMAKGGTG